MATMAASESSFSSETEGSSSKGDATGKSQVSGKKSYILLLNDVFIEMFASTYWSKSYKVLRYDKV